jgi:hypothetical protein
MWAQCVSSAAGCGCDRRVDRTRRVLPQSRCWSRSRSEVAFGELVVSIELAEVAVDVVLVRELGRGPACAQRRRAHADAGRGRLGLGARVRPRARRNRDRRGGHAATVEVALGELVGPRLARGEHRRRANRRGSLAVDEQQLCPYRAPTASWSLLRSLLFRGAVKRLDTPRNGQRIGTCRSRSSFKLVGGHPRSGQNPDSDSEQPPALIALNYSHSCIRSPVPTCAAVHTRPRPRRRSRPPSSTS